MLFSCNKGGNLITDNNFYKESIISQTETEMVPDEVSGEDPGAFSPQESPLSQTSSEMGVNNPLSAEESSIEHVEAPFLQTSSELTEGSAIAPDAEGVSPQTDPETALKAGRQRHTASISTHSGTELPAPGDGVVIRRRRVRQRSATRPVSVLSIDEGRTVETEADKARNDLLDLVESQKTGRIFTGILQGVERAVNSKTGSMAVIYHGAFKVIIPAEEAVTLPDDTRGRSPDELYHYMLTKRLGAEVDYIVKGIDQQSNLAVGSRLDAMAAKRKEYYFGTDRDGNHRIYSGICAEARIVSVIRAGIFVDLFGLETYIPLRELSYQRWMDAGLYFQAGQRVLVKVLEVERSGKDQVRVVASVKQAGENPYEKALRMYSVDSCYVGTVSMVDMNGVFVALDGGIDCLCSYPKRGRPPRGARVTVRILGINHESKAVVAFETLYRDKLEVCAHSDIEDKDQTVTFNEKPEIKTTATVNGEKKAEPKGEVTIKDTVSYAGLIPGKTYKLSGVLMDKSGNASLLVDGQKVTTEKEFTPEKATGTEEITFTLDASALAGKSVVVFETLTHDGKEVAAHADINDAGQTVKFEKPDEPQIKTTATMNGEKKAEPKGEVTITDTVSYTGLTPGKTYKLSGVLMDKSTGKKLLVDGNEVTAEKEFTPIEASGTEEITFTFDASALAGKSIVVFESLYHDGKEIAIHADIYDKDQTVEFKEPDKPHIKTTATVDGEKEVDPLEKITLTDTVTYSNLTPGKTYTVKGVLMDKSTGKKLLVDGKEVTAEATFTPEKPEGDVTVTFKFDGSKITAKTNLVVFETLYRDGKEIAAHTDINDEGQTLTLTTQKPKTPTPDVPKTGDDRSITLPLILLGASLAGLVTLFMFWFRRKKLSSQTGSENEGRK